MAATISVGYQNSFILIIMCFFPALYLFSRLFKKPKDGSDLPPSPPSLPIIGHLHLLLSTLIHKSLQRISNKYGPLLHLRVFNYAILLVSCPSVLYEIFKAHDVNISSRGLPPIEESLFFGSFSYFMAPYGDYWKFMKKLVATKLIAPQTQEQSRSDRAVEIERFYANLLDKARKKESVDIFQEAKGLVRNIIFKISLGRSCVEDNNEAERVVKLSNEMAALSKKLFLAQILNKPLEKLGISLFRKEIMAVSDKVDELLESIVVERKEKLDEHQCKDLMDTFLAAYRDENAEYKINMNHIKAFFAELFTGTIDSTSTTIQWAMAEILNSPNTLERLREEIESVVGRTRMIQETDLPKLPFLDAVVKEVLRLHAHGPLSVRKFQEGCKIRGFYIPENTTLVVNAYAIMRDPNYWEDPDEFKPERFLDSLRPLPAEEARREQALKYIPFGTGRRACPGGNLASIFVRTAVGVMVQCFDWEIKGEKINMEEAAGRIFLNMAHPLKCTPSPRFLIHSLPFNLQTPTP
uniref:Cytochrome P450 705A37 n=1 Tax=Isatis tinctoria TaxID=161756 RepID=A0A8F0K878_ISATI|nr:cytochrome P450 705A37 [Isatis tinctoria]